MRLISTLCAVIFTSVPCWGANTSVTIFLDGALVKNETSAVREKVQFPLPASFKEGSLRVRPLTGCQIDRVKIETGKPDPHIAREMARVAERRGVLNDRLKALEIRESIFISAAKSQSGKALRKTKTNPEPITLVRQGTEYAISQLEGVYRARRIAETELKSLEEKDEALKKAVREKSANIFLSKKSCRIEISYLRTDLKWIPAYDFRINKAGETDVIIRAVFPRIEKGARISVVASLLSEMDESVTPMPVPDENTKELMTFKFPVEHEKLSSEPISTLSFSVKNLSNIKLPSGEATCFLRGEYLGKTLFKGAAPGEAIHLYFGN